MLPIFEEIPKHFDQARSPTPTRTDYANWPTSTAGCSPPNRCTPPRPVRKPRRGPPDVERQSAVDEVYGSPASRVRRKVHKSATFAGW